MGGRQTGLSGVPHGLAWKWGLASAIGVLLLALAFVASRLGHRSPPWPIGAVLRVEARRSYGPFDEIQVVACDVGGPAIEIRSPEQFGSAVVVDRYRYPGGESIPPDAAPTAGADAATLTSSIMFDFDGDGAADRVEEPDGMETGIVRVVSGRDGRTLFEDDDPIEYETQHRAFPLGDLDGDGFAELALVHPRSDRSRYDLELWDRLLGAKSWITVVSGRAATR